MVKESLTYKLQHQYNTVDEMLQNLSSEFILKKHRPEKWSIHENLAHLGRYHEVFLSRLTQILSEDNPEFGRYNTSNDPDFDTWGRMTTSEVIQKTKSLRGQCAEQLISLSSDQLARTGTHPKLGALTVEEWVEFFLLHENHHLYTIFWLIHEFKA